MSNLTTPTNADGFFKKIEWVATITPNAQPPGGQFEWIQKLIGEGIWDGDVILYGASWADDSPGPR